MTESAGVLVDLLSCDMGPNNISVANKLGFGVRLDKNGSYTVINKIQHPVDKSRFLYLFYDVPHVEKNLANAWRTYKQIELHDDVVLNYGLQSNVADIEHVS